MRSKTSDPLRECNKHTLNMVKRLSGLAITVIIFVLLGCSPLPAHMLCIGYHFSLKSKVILTHDKPHSTTRMHCMDL